VDFSLAAYVPEAFVHVVDVLGDRPIGALAEATGTASARYPYDTAVLAAGDSVLAVEHGPLTVGPARIARLPVAWRSAVGLLVIEAELRVLPVDDGTDPVSELLLSGAFCTVAGRKLHPVAWLRHVIEGVALDVARPHPWAFLHEPAGVELARSA